MLSIQGPMKGAGKANYYLNLAREDYYLNGGEPPGLWHGKAAKAIGLPAQVERRAFHDLLLGFGPNKSGPVVQNAGRETRQSGWDFTLSAPKAPTLLWALGDDRTRAIVENAHDKAVRKVLDYAERNFGASRRGKGGTAVEPAALLWALFQHGTSRAQDPQLHTHCILINLGLRADGSFGSLVTKALYQNKIALGALYQAELAAGLTRELGLQIEPKRVGFGIRGVPEELCDAFSKRRAQIESLLEMKGESSAIAAKRAALESRDRKSHVPRELLFPKWQKVAAAWGWRGIEVSCPTITKEKEATQLPSEKLYALLVRKNEYENIKPTLFRNAARLAQRVGATCEDIEAAVQRFRRSSGRPPLFSIERKQLFPNAPKWSPAKKLALPAIKIRRNNKWGKVLFEVSLPNAKIQLRKRKLFQNAPSWNPARKLQLPAIKIWTGKYAKKKPELTANKSSLTEKSKLVRVFDPVTKTVQHATL